MNAKAAESPDPAALSLGGLFDAVGICIIARIRYN